MSFALVLKKTSWYRRRYSRPLRVKNNVSKLLISAVYTPNTTKSTPQAFCIKGKSLTLLDHQSNKYFCSIWKYLLFVIIHDF